MTIGLNQLQQLSVLNNLLTLTLLNVDSLKCHIHDLSIDKDLIHVDLLCLIETQLCDCNGLSFIKSYLSGTFTISFNNNVNNYRSFHESVYPLEHERLDGLSITNFVRPVIHVASLIMAVIYRSRYLYTLYLKTMS